MVHAHKCFFYYLRWFDYGNNFAFTLNHKSTEEQLSIINHIKKGLKKNEKIKVCALAGSGKTTVLKKSAQISAKTRKRFENAQEKELKFVRELNRARQNKDYGKTGKLAKELGKAQKELKQARAEHFDAKFIYCCFNKSNTFAFLSFFCCPFKYNI